MGEKNIAVNDAIHLQESEPKKYCEMFVGGLDHKTSEQTLKAHFEQWGELVDCAIKRNPITRESCGYGFVTYRNACMVDDAVAASPHEIDGRKVGAMRVFPREDKNKDMASGTIPMDLDFIQANANRCVCLAHRMNTHNFIASIRQNSQLKKVWANRGLPVDRESLQAAAAGKDTFDMSHLRESLPSEPNTDDKDAHEFREKKCRFEKYLQARRRYKLEALRRRVALLNSIRSSNAGTLESRTNIAKELHGDIRRIWTPQTLMRAGIDPSGSSNSTRNMMGMSTPEKRFPISLRGEKSEERQNVVNERQNAQHLQELDSYFKDLQSLIDARKDGIKNTEERLILKLRLQKQESRSSHFVGNDDLKISNVSLRTQHIRENTLLSRQMSRLRLANSGRGILESLEEMEEEYASYPSKCERAEIMKVRRERVRRLTEFMKAYKLREANK